MASLIEKLAAKLAFVHARSAYRHFLQSTAQLKQQQEAALRRALATVSTSDFGRRYGLERVRGIEDFRRAVPLHSYDDVWPTIERVWDGDTQALFSPGRRVLMFATSSGTTARPKLIPVTAEFVQDYRRGWNVFGVKMLIDHRGSALRAILQCTGRHDVSRSPTGIPAGAITGLLASTQKRIVRRFYVGRPEIAQITDARARYYTLMRFGVVRDVSFAVTANPATLIQMARVASEESDRLIRDVHDGTLSRDLVADSALHGLLAPGLRADPQRARELERVRKNAGVLRPADYWRLSFLACWTGGSMGLYLPRLRQWYGAIPVRDIGLLASEGRVTIPLEDESAAGVLALSSALFEFIPVAEVKAEQPQTMLAHELEDGQEYAVVLTNPAGLVRYRLDDVVRVQGRVGQTPCAEFLYRAGRVCSLAGEKLTENQCVEAVRAACRHAGLIDVDFLVAPCWDDPPYYRVNVDRTVPSAFLPALDTALCKINEEYDSRRKSLRLGPLQLRILPAGAIAALDRQSCCARGGAVEQFKRTCLYTQPGGDDAALGCAISGKIR